MYGQHNVRTRMPFEMHLDSTIRTRQSHTSEKVQTYDTSIGFVLITLVQPQELIPEQMWLRLVEWPGSSIWVVHVWRFRSNSIICTYMIFFNACLQDVYFPMRSDLPIHFHRKVVRRGQLLQVSRSGSRLCFEVWRWPSTTTEGDLHGPRSPHAGPGGWYRLDRDRVGQRGEVQRFEHFLIFKSRSLVR